MIVFTRKYPLQRLLKKRTFKMNKKPKLKYGTSGIYCLHTFRFEYRYCLFLRKMFKRLFSRRRRKIATCQKRKTWLFIRPNYTLTHKSKNARMGKGKGNFKRWCTIVYPGRTFIEHLNVNPRVYINFMNKINIKLKIQLKILHQSNSTIKRYNINNGLIDFTDTFTLLHVRGVMY